MENRNDLPPALLQLQEKLLHLRHQGELELQNGDIGFASAPSNIALIKYWGKAENRRQIPLNPSISYTLGGFRSFTKVSVLGRFFPENETPASPMQHRLLLNGTSSTMPRKMVTFLDSLLFPWGKDIALAIESFNNFPTACGIASSASGYAALCGAIFDLLQLEKRFTPEEQNLWLTEWARLGSGSASRSCSLGQKTSFVQWTPPEHRDGFSTTETLKFHPLFEQLEHAVLVLDDREKEISSSEGHKYASSSPLQKIRLAGLESQASSLRHALQKGDFHQFSALTEADAFAMHAVMQTTSHPALYLTMEVAEVVAAFVSQRNARSLPALWTLDAGPNIHILYLPEAREWLKEFCSEIAKQHTVKILANNLKSGLLTGKASYEELSRHPHLISHSL